MAQINIRLSDAERDRIAAEAQAQSITISDYIRQRLQADAQRVDLTALEQRLADRLAAMEQRIPPACIAEIRANRDRERAAEQTAR